MTETPFKLRYANHTQSFRQEKYKNQTELSKYIWSLKHKKSEYDITWRILQRAKSYSTGSKKCNLCTSEKFYILCKPQMASLNTRAGLINTCNHRKKYLLSNASSFDVPRSWRNNMTDLRSKSSRSKSTWREQTARNKFVVDWFFILCMNLLPTRSSTLFFQF